MHCAPCHLRVAHARCRMVLGAPFFFFVVLAALGSSWRCLPRPGFARFGFQAGGGAGDPHFPIGFGGKVWEAGFRLAPRRSRTRRRQPVVQDPVPGALLRWPRRHSRSPFDPGAIGQEPARSPPRERREAHEPDCPERSLNQGSHPVCLVVDFGPRRQPTNRTTYDSATRSRASIG